MLYQKRKTTIKFIYLKITAKQRIKGAKIMRAVTFPQDEDWQFWQNFVNDHMFFKKPQNPLRKRCFNHLLLPEISKVGRSLFSISKHTSLQRTHFYSKEKFGPRLCLILRKLSLQDLFLAEIQESFTRIPITVLYKHKRLFCKLPFIFNSLTKCPSAQSTFSLP